jgi:hypothetical protein
MPPNNRMERGVIDKVHGRGRLSSVVEQVTSARVRDALACARSCERWAALPRAAFEARGNQVDTAQPLLGQLRWIRHAFHPEALVFGTLS